MAENTITADQIRAGQIADSHIASGANIAESKLAINGLTILKDGTRAFTGDQSMGNNKLTNVTNGSSSGDAVNKGQLDAAIALAISPFTPKNSVRVTTTANITLSGAQTIDGVSVIAGDRVLVKNQSSALENGLYLCASGAWTRTVDMDSWAEVPGAIVSVQEGTTLADTIWISTANLGGTLETTAITWTNPFSGIGLTTSNFVFDETPSGTINGSNADFTVANTPTSNTLRVYRNGMRVASGSGNGYTLSGTTISFTTAPITGDSIRVDYMK